MRIASDPPDHRIAPSQAEAFEIIGGNAARSIVLLADHATNHIPAEFESLGLPQGQLERHIAFDIGIDGLTRRLAQLLDAPAVMSRFSRLLIDPNRGPDDPTLVMRIADGAFVPGNARIGADVVEARRQRFHKPYHQAIAGVLDSMAGQGIVPVLVSLHSFTPIMKGRTRPWQAGVLWDADPRLARPLLAALEREGDIVVGDNEPYDGALAGDTIDQHATLRGLSNALIEVRQDLICDAEGIESWAQRLARLLKPLMHLPDIRRIMHHSSRTRDRIRSHL